MAGLEALLQRIARSLEEKTGSQQPGGDLRARMGYGSEDEVEELASDPVWEPETGREPESARTPASAWKPKTAWSPETSERPAPASTSQRAAETHRAPPADHSLRGATASRTTLPHPHASPTSVLSENIRARLRTPDALREAFVIKEILDRPLARRRGK